MCRISSQEEFEGKKYGAASWLETRLVIVMSGVGVAVTVD